MQVKLFSSSGREVAVTLLLFDLKFVPQIKRKVIFSGIHQQNDGHNYYTSVTDFSGVLLNIHSLINHNINIHCTGR